MILDHYGVTDLYAAAALIASGFRLAFVEPEARGGNPPRFLFDADDRIADTEQQHREGELLVNSRLYAEAIRDLRSWSTAQLSRKDKQPTRIGMPRS
jgi:hypothetical protein